MPPASAPVPSVAAPFLNVTISPFGGTPLLELTVAVNVTLCPLAIGVAEDVTNLVVAAFATICASCGDALPLKSALPLYVAPMLCVPAFRVEVVNSACPDPLSVTVPSAAAPSLNVTDPVAIPEVNGVTVAVNVTVCPGADGFTEETSAVDVPACVTLWISGAVMCGLNLPSPAYTTDIVCVPAARFETVRLAPTEFR